MRVAIFKWNFHFKIMVMQVNRTNMDKFRPHSILFVSDEQTAIALPHCVRSRRVRKSVFTIEVGRLSQRLRRPVDSERPVA
jgi:hypothetical protein